MPSLTACLCRPVVVAVLALLPATAPAAPASEGDAKKAESPVDKIRKALDQTIDLEMTDQSLNQAINQLREQTKLNIVLDRMTVINLMGMDPEQSPVSVKLQGVKVRSALRTLLSQYNLSFAIVGDTIVVTTEDMAMHRQMRQRVNIDLDKVSLATALKQLSRDTATNLTIDPRVQKDAQTPVSLQLEDVPLETAVRLLAEVAGLKPVRMGNVLFVTSKTNAADLRSDPDLAPTPGLGGPRMEELIIGPNGRMIVPGNPGIGIAPLPPPPVPNPVPAPGNQPAGGTGTAPPAGEKPDNPPPDKESKPDTPPKPPAENEKLPARGLS
jgi:type II secretory pathway component GspD/PulD (secretin)